MTCENLRLHPINGSDPFRLSGVKAKLFDPRMIFSPAALWTYWSDVVIISERSWPGWVNLSLWLLRISSAIHTLLWAFTPEKNIHFISPDLDSEISRHIKPGSFYKDLTNHYFNCPYLPVMWLGIAISHPDLHLWNFFKIHCTKCVHLRDSSPLAFRHMPECVGKM